jgi:hypothetical protein
VVQDEPRSAANPGKRALTLPALRRSLALVLLTAAAACAIPAQFGDLGPGGRVIGDDSCARDADCLIINAQADPCSCVCGYQAVNRSWGAAWSEKRKSVDRSRCSAACGPCPGAPEHALCVDGRCVAAGDEQISRLREAWCPPTPPAAPAPPQTSAAAPDRKTLDASCAAPLVQKQALTSVGGYPLEEAPVGGFLPSLPPASLLGRPFARHQLQPVALEPAPMTLTHTEYGDGTLAIVSLRLAEGHCVVGTWHLNFGGNGVESWVRQVVVGADKRAALILIETIGHFRPVFGVQPPIPAGEQRFWTVLSAASDGLRALSDGDTRLGGEPRVILVGPPLAKAEDMRLEVGKGRRVWRIDRKSGKFEPSQ